MGSKRASVRTDDQEVEVRYANWVAQLVGVMMPWSLYMVMGRASAKTVQILSERVQVAAQECPGAPFAWASDTYADLHKNVIPSLIDGLRLLGWEMDVHYVVNREPPKEWKDRMYNVCTDWKNTMVFYTGFNFTFISLDRPAIGAGRSYVGIFGDEVKYFPEERFTNLLKAVRGFRVKYGNSPWYRSRTLTTDMPNPNHIGEYDWILKLCKQNDREKIRLLMQTGFLFNRIKKEYVAALQFAKDCDVKLHKGQIGEEECRRADFMLRQRKRAMMRWENRFNELRKGVSFFMVTSSYVNVDILGLEWFSDEFSEGLEGVMCNVLSVAPKLEAAQLFYCNLCADNFFADGNLSDVIESHKFGWEPDCSVLRYLNMGMPLEAGMDAGNMMSMVFGQREGSTMRVLKELFTLPPNSVRELADEFIRYFKPHKRKILKLYYDRAMNNYKGVHADTASLIKKCIETDANGNRTGWVVQLMSIGQGIIGSNLEYRFFSDLLSGYLEKSLYKLYIDRYNCSNLKSEMEVTQTKLATGPGGGNLVVKKKTGDKLPTHRLPKESTNLTDALKYFILRKNVIAAWQNSKGVSGAAVV